MTAKVRTWLFQVMLDFTNHCVESTASICELTVMVKLPVLLTDKYQSTRRYFVTQMSTILFIAIATLSFATFKSLCWQLRCCAGKRGGTLWQKQSKDNEQLYQLNQKVLWWRTGILMMTAECENACSHLIPMTTATGKDNFVPGYFWLILPMK